jgi:hypothetical protein
LKNRIRELVLLSAIAAFAAFPALAQGTIGTMTVATPAAAAADPAPRPPSWGVPEGKTLFPHDWVRGYVEYSVAPPHNEPDLGRCSPSSSVIVMRPAGRIPTATPTRATCWAATSKCSPSEKPSRGMFSCSSRPLFRLEIMCHSSNTPRRWRRLRTTARLGLASSCQKISRSA